jgi:SAM-dependent methyltransferase
MAYQSPPLNDPALFLKISTQLWSDVNVQNEFPNNRPLIAHYTLLSTLEQIVKNDEVWLSNPLYMNDIEEIRFGMSESYSAFQSHTGIADACGSDQRRGILRNRFFKHYLDFEQIHDFDTYVLCCSHHKPEDNEGLLSMWRAYGGNGNGAAIVLNCQQVNFKPNSPITVTQVSYKSREERRAWIGEKLDQFAQILQSIQIPDNQLQAAASALVGRFRMFALTTKHHGFREEQEWRFIYSKQLDPNQLLTPMLDYAIGPNGIEPKLKLKLLETEEFPNMCLSALVDRIILGPTLSEAMAVSSVKRMLTVNKKEYLIPRLFASSTPYRATRR